MLKDKVNKFLEVGVSLKSIAAHSNIHYSTLSKWLNGVRELNQQSCYGNPKTIFVPSSVCYIYSGNESDTFNAIPA